MGDKNDRKTFYKEGDEHLSDMGGLNKARIKLGDTPRSYKYFPYWNIETHEHERLIEEFKKFRDGVGAGDADKWKEKVMKKIHKYIKKGFLRQVENKPCNLYVVFRIEKNTKKVKDSDFADVDNLLKLFLDALKKEGKKGKEARQDGEERRFLIEDDSYFRGIRAEKEVVNSTGEQGVVFCYFVTKTFWIKDVIPIDSLTALKEYRDNWEQPMQLIEAKECDERGNPVEPVYRFIDNAPGMVIQVKGSGEMHPDAIPGYSWKKGDTVEGCMVFQREPTSKPTEKQDPSFWWLKKWSTPY